MKVELRVKAVGYASFGDFINRFKRLNVDLEDGKYDFSIVEEARDRIVKYSKTYAPRFSGYMAEALFGDINEQNEIIISAPGADEYFIAIEKGFKQHYIPATTWGVHKPAGVIIPTKNMIRVGDYPGAHFVRRATEDVQSEMGYLAAEAFDKERKEVGL